jgi:hypothetical protein
MRHVPSSVLRRLVDEPLAVPDTARQHLVSCGRCRAATGEIAENAARAFRLLAAPRLVPDTGVAWVKLQHGLAAATGAPVTIPRYPTRRLVNGVISSGAAVAIGVLVAGVAAAATLTTVFNPTRVAPVPVSGSDLRAIGRILDIGTAQPGGSPAAAGSQRLPFGTLRWASAGRSRRVASVAQAQAMTGLDPTSPATLPAGVGPARAIMVQPTVTATVGFSRSASSPVGGSTLVITGGPAILVQYGGTSSAGTSSGGTDLTTLGILTMRRPVASSTGATTSQLEAFLLSRPGVPAGLAQEIRLLGNLSTILPVPVPPGAATEHVRIGGAPGVLIADASHAAAGVIWESRDGIVHVVAGLLDRKDIVNVARQIG